MDKGFALNDVLAGKALAFGAQDLGQLATAGAEVVRFELRLSGFTSWGKDILGLYADMVQQIAATLPKTMIIGQLTHQIVAKPSQAKWNAPAGPDGANQFIRDFEAAVHQIVPALPAITHWEIWNEPNNASATNPTFIQQPLYATLLKRTFDAIKAVQPQSTVISGGIFAFDQIPGGTVTSRALSGSDYFDNVVTALKQQNSFAPPPFDGIGLHLYLDQSGPVEPARLQSYINSYYAVLDASLGRHVPQPLPIYITEAGWSTPSDPPKKSDEPSVAPEVQAANLTTLIQICRTNGFVGQDNTSNAVAPYVAALCWFDLRDGGVPRNFGVFDKNGGEKLALAAFQKA